MFFDKNTSIEQDIKDLLGSKVVDVPRVSVGLRKVTLNPKETRTQVRPRWYQKEAKWTRRGCDLNDASSA